MFERANNQAIPHIDNFNKAFRSCYAYIRCSVRTGVVLLYSVLAACSTSIERVRQVQLTPKEHWLFRPTNGTTFPPSWVTQKMVESGAHQISCVLSRHDPSYSCRTKLLLELRGTLQSHPHMIWHEILRVCGVLGIVGVHLELWKHKCTKGSTTELYPCTFSCYLMCSAFFPCLTSTYQVLLHEEIVEITLFQHTPCRYLPISLIDRHPIWPPQPVHSHRLVRAIARQISSANIPNGPKTFDFCSDGSPDIQWESGKTRIHIIGGTLIKILREGFWRRPWTTCNRIQIVSNSVSHSHLRAALHSTVVRCNSKG